MVEVLDAAALVAATVDVARVGTVAPEVEAVADVSAGANEVSGDCVVGCATPVVSAAAPYVVAGLEAMLDSAPATVPLAV
jgi:hypothetical protein